jgi:hypothetical protein
MEKRYGQQWIKQWMVNALISRLDLFGSGIVLKMLNDKCIRIYLQQVPR